MDEKAWTLLMKTINDMDEKIDRVEERQLAWISKHERLEQRVTMFGGAVALVVSIVATTLANWWKSLTH